MKKQEDKLEIGKRVIIVPATQNQRGRIVIGELVYDCEIRNGVRYTGGMPNEQFVQTLPEEQLIDLALYGMAAVQNDSFRLN